MKVVILAGGRGKRLRPYTDIIPKPLMPIYLQGGAKPILEVIIQRLRKQGIKDFFLTVNYKDYLFKTVFEDGSKYGVNINYVKENKPLGTAGPLKNLEGKLKGEFFVMNGDLLTDLKIGRAHV